MVFNKPKFFETKIVEYMGYVLLSPLILAVLPFVIMILILHFVLVGKRKIFGPRLEYSSWFAWLPVWVIYESPNKFPVRRLVWLEMVMRKSNDPLNPLMDDIIYQPRALAE